LEKFADDAYRNALMDRKKSIIYDNLCKLAFVRIHFNFSSLSIQKRVVLEDNAMTLVKAMKEYSKQQNRTRQKKSNR
jgi:hypothetical protein